MLNTEFVWKQHLNKIIKAMIAKHTSDEEFSGSLDAAVQQELFFEKLYHLAVLDDAYRHINEDFECYNVIATGKFGLALNNWLRDGYYSRWVTYCENEGILLVNGGLRDGEPIIDLEPYWQQIQDEKFVLMDDSFFSGRTRDIIADALHEHGGELVHTYVVYDGSHKLDSRVTSLYRYCDKVGIDNK